MAIIGNVVVSVFASTEGLSKSLTSARKRIKTFAKNAVKVLKKLSIAVGAGASAGITAIIATVNKYATEIDNLAKTSSKLGVTVSALQKLQYQAELTGVSTGTMNMAMQRMVRRVSEAAKGTGAAKDALKELGLEAQDLNNLSPDKQFYAISEAMKSISNQGDKVRLAMKIFDTEGVALVNTMNGNLKQMGEEFDSLGINITGSTAKMVEAYNDSKTKLAAIFSGFGLQLTAQLAEPFTMVLEYITKTIQEMGGLEVAANKVALGMVKSLRGVVDVINEMIKGINKFELMSKRAELTGAEHRGAIEGGASKLTGGFLGDPTGNKSNIDRIRKEIEALETPISSLSKIDEFIAEMQRKIEANKATGGASVEEGVLINSNHYKAIEASAEAANERQKADTKAAEKTNILSSAIEKATKAISPTKTEITKSSHYSKIGGLNPGLSGFSLGGKSSVTATTAATNAIEKNNVSLGKININMQTDTGKVAGEIFGEPAFLSSLKSFADKQTNKEARAVTI